MEKTLYKIKSSTPQYGELQTWGEYAEIVKIEPHMFRNKDTGEKFYRFRFWDFDGKSLIRRINTEKFHENLFILGPPIEVSYDSILYP